MTLFSKQELQMQVDIYSTVITEIICLNILFQQKTSAWIIVGELQKTLPCNEMRNMYIYDVTYWPLHIG